MTVTDLLRQRCHDGRPWAAVCRIRRRMELAKRGGSPHVLPSIAVDVLNPAILPEYEE